MAPEPNRLVTYWWKLAHVLHWGVTQAISSISESNVDNLTWFAEGKTRLIPKPGEFLSEKQ